MPWGCPGELPAPPLSGPRPPRRFGGGGVSRGYRAEGCRRPVGGEATTPGVGPSSLRRRTRRRSVSAGGGPVRVRRSTRRRPRAGAPRTQRRRATVRPRCRSRRASRRVSERIRHSWASAKASAARAGALGAASRRRAPRPRPRACPPSSAREARRGYGSQNADDQERPPQRGRTLTSAFLAGVLDHPLHGRLLRSAAPHEKHGREHEYREHSELRPRDAHRGRLPHSRCPRDA